jgi:hypothetical protein
MDDKEDLPLGFARLVRVEGPSLRVGHLGGLLLPIEMAKAINAARFKLSEDAGSLDAWEQACMYPAPADHFAFLEADEAENDRFGPSKPFAQLSPPAPSAPGGSESTTEAGRPEQAPTRKRRIPGRAVRVIDVAQIAQRREELDLRSKYLSGEKKGEVRLMDHLEACGDKRVVGLRSDWRVSISRLRADMPHLAEVIDRIEACCALSALTRQPLRIPPLLLVGPPGVGKTHFARQLAAMLGVPKFVYQLESAESTSVLTGAEKHWSNSEVGQLFKLIVQGGAHANPVVVLDELDKAPTSVNHYRPTNALHALLEPSTARKLRDTSIDFVFDASYVVYIVSV